MIPKILTTTILLSLFNLAAALGQTARAFERSGDNAMEQNAYWTASSYYKDALKIKENSPDLWYKYAESCRLRFALEEAEKGYQKVITLTKNEPNSYRLSPFYLALVKKYSGQYQEAIKIFEQFLKKEQDNNSYFYKKAVQEKLGCELAKDWLSSPAEAEIRHLGENINTPYSDFAPHFADDILYYSSLRFKPNEDNGLERRYSRVMTSSEENKGKTLTGNINKSETHTANSAFSADGTEFFFTQCEYTSDNEILCQIYSRKKEGDQWSRPQPLEGFINVDGFTATHPFPFIDKKGKECLFFASDRPGGQGKLDIWYAFRNLNGSYREPINAGEAVNSIDNELSPFFDSDAEILYFSSDWHPGLGGFDIFKSEWIKENRWSEPVNLGYPINSSHHDFHLWMDESMENGYFSSNRPGSQSLSDDDACCHDIYAIQTKELLPPVPPIDTDTIPIAIVPPEPDIFTDTTEIAIPPVGIEPESPFERFQPIPVYFHNDEPDSNTTRTYTDVNYQDNFNFYYGLKSEYEQQFGMGDLTLETEVDRFFEEEVRAGMERLEEFAGLLVSQLGDGENISVAIRGFTSPRAPTLYNAALAERRINSIINYLEQFQGQVLQPYIRSGQLTFLTTPFGESTVPPGISDQYADRRNSIYSVAASRERRVEIYEVRLRD